MMCKFGNLDLISFDDLTRALNEMPDQTDGLPCAISDIGEPYVAFSAKGIARPGDEKIVERLVVAEMCEKLDQYFADKKGRIYWRTRLEIDREPHHVIQRMDANGLDEDFITGQKCVMDKNWRKIHAYCRLVRTTCPIPDFSAERKVA